MPADPEEAVIQVVNDYKPHEAVAALLGLCFSPGARVLDATYGHGGFWNGEQPSLAMDGRLLPGVAAVSDFCRLPLAGESVPVVVYDPPFQPLTTVGVIAARYTTPVKGTGALRELVIAGARECWRVASEGVIIKCQDYIHDHKPVWMSLWLVAELGEPYEFMICTRKSKLRASNWSRQRSVWRNQSQYYVWRKGRGLR